MKYKTHMRPPLWASHFLEWYCREDLIEEIKGDIYESFYHTYKDQGYSKAKWGFIWDVLRFFKPSNLKRANFNSNHSAMFNNYLRTSFRSMLRNKVFSLINILGLALAMTTCFFIFKYVTHERSYDNFHTEADNIYRVSVDRYHEGSLSQEWAAASAAIGPALKDNFPVVREFVKMRKNSSTLKFEDVAFREERAFYASEAFFQMFSFKLISGVDSLVLKEPFTVVLSESTARKYFKNEDPVGKTLKLNESRDILVTGVFENVPQNSHMKFDLLYSFETVVALEGESVKHAWDHYGFYTYLLLENNSDVSVFESEIPAMVDRAYGEILKSQNKSLDFNLQPIQDIHLDSHYMYEFEANGDRSMVVIITIIGVFILVIAWVNYINLSTAKVMDRAKEIGVRKVLGSGKRSLIKQILFEAMMINTLAALLTIVLVVFCIPQFNGITGQTITPNELISLEFIGFLILMTLASGMMSGFYPAMIMVRFSPVTVLKGKFSRSVKGELIRKSLVIFQFVASISLMIGVFIIYEQVEFLRNQKLGIDIERTLILRGPRVVYDQEYYNQHKAFKTEMLRNPAISSLTISSQIPGNASNGNAGSVKLVQQDESQGKAYALVRFDDDFIEAYGLELLAGKNFSTDQGGAIWSSVLLNESARIQMGFETNEEVLGQKMELYPGSSPSQIIGVINDYHQESPKTKFEPTIYHYYPLGDFYSFKISGADLSATIAAIESGFNSFFEDNNGFDYFFLDEHYDRQYKSELQFSNTIATSAILAIVIACLGLLGLSTFTISQRKKEIGIRKVLGAGLGSILSLLIRNFSIPIVIAFFISAPLAWYFMNDWLNNFAYQVGLEWWFFAIPGSVALGIALLILSQQTIKAAISNPVESLKCE